MKIEITNESMISGSASAESEDYAAWQISAERQRHEWMRLRRSIVRTRMRIVLYGHATYFASCWILDAAGVQCATLMFLGWFSLCFISISMLLMEHIHVKLLPRTPPRFVVRRSGVTEYSEEGPHEHWDWSRACQLSIESDSENPAYRSLVFSTKPDSYLFGKLFRFSIPLPPQIDAEIDEHAIIAALSEALEANHIRWKAQPGGAVALVRE